MDERSAVADAETARHRSEVTLAAAVAAARAERPSRPPIPSAVRAALEPAISSMERADLRVESLLNLDIDTSFRELEIAIAAKRDPRDCILALDPAFALARRTSLDARGSLQRQLATVHDAPIEVTSTFDIELLRLGNEQARLYQTWENFLQSWTANLDQILVELQAAAPTSYNDALKRQLSVQRARFQQELAALLPGDQG